MCEILHIIIILLIILISGLLGGFTNYKFTKDGNVSCVPSLLLGICASICVPLFLQVMSNNILDLPKEGNIFPKKNYFILAGFCVLASLFSKHFLSSLYAKVGKLDEDLVTLGRTVENIEDKNTEQDENENEQNPFTMDANDDEMKVIKAMSDSRYLYRTVNGIAKETNLDADTVFKILQILQNAGKAKSKTSKKGNNKLLWELVY